MDILYPRDPVLGAWDQEALFPLSLLTPAPNDSETFNSAPLKRAFLQETGDTVKEMGVGS